MSNNTQEQGRTFFTERGFTFTPTPGDDIIRTLARFEMEMQRQLYAGDVTHDPVAKQAAMDAAAPSSFTFTPANATGVTATVGTAANITLTTVDTTGMTAAVTTGTLPVGLTLSVVGATVKLTGTPTTAGAISFTVTVSKAGTTTKSFTVAGTVAAS